MSTDVTIAGEVARTARDLAARGLVEGTAGNVSARDAEHIAITPTGAPLAEVQEDDIVIVDAAGDVVSGRFAPTSELALHLALYRRYDCGAVVHTHAPSATAVACAMDELPLIHYEQLLLGGAVRVAPFVAFGTDELADAAADAIEGRTAALLANHGTIAHGADLAGAARATELLEWLSALYLRAAAIGPPRTLTAEQAQAVIESATRRDYGRRQTLEPPEQS
jgi:L-fuculose-phosphate aldolase